MSPSVNSSSKQFHKSPNGDRHILKNCTIRSLCTIKKGANCLTMLQGDELGPEEIQEFRVPELERSEPLKSGMECARVPERKANSFAVCSMSGVESSHMAVL